MVQLKLFNPFGAESFTVLLEDNILVYDGMDYVLPQNARYIKCYVVNNPSETLAFDEPVRQIVTQQARLLLVLDVEPVGPGPFDPVPIIEVPDPAEGECICMVTCNGIELSYVVVTNDPPIPPFVPPEVISDPGGFGGDCGCGCSDCESCGNECGCFNCKPCCSPHPEIATHIRCEFWNASWYFFIF